MRGFLSKIWGSPLAEAFSDIDPLILELPNERKSIQMYLCGQVQTIDRTASSIIALDRKQRAVDLGLRPIIRPCLFILRSIKALFQLRQDFLDDAGMLCAGQPLIEAAKLEGEALVVNAEAMVLL